jgi:DNA transformation protein
MTAPRAAPAGRKQKPTPPFVARCLTLLLPFGPVVSRGMFGGWGIFLDGVMFALIAQETLYLKTDAETRARFAEAGSEPFVYAGRVKPVEMSYWRAPAGSLDRPESLQPWAELAVAAARRAATHKAERRAARRRA